MPWKKSSRDMFPPLIPSVGPLRARVALFTGCVMDMMSASIHSDSIQVLTRNGCEVHLIPGEECCGALLGHSGDREGAKTLAQKNIAAFGTNFDAVVVNAAGCGAYLKQYSALVGTTAKDFSARVFDIQEFLYRLGLVEPPTPIAKTVAVQEPCHLVHAQKVSGQVGNLLKKIAGLTIVPLEGAKDCCGSAGIYNLTHYRDSMQLLDVKMKRVAQSGADMLVAANPGCLYQLRWGVRRHGLKMEVLHPITLLARAYELGKHITN